MSSSKRMSRSDVGFDTGCRAFSATDGLVRTSSRIVNNSLEFIYAIRSTLCASQKDFIAAWKCGEEEKVRLSARQIEIIAGTYRVGTVLQGGQHIVSAIPYSAATSFKQQKAEP